MYRGRIDWASSKLITRIIRLGSSDLQWLNMSINAKKSCCLRIGPRAETICNDLTCISGVSLTWVNEIRTYVHNIVKSRVCI